MPTRVLFLNTRDQCGADVAVHLTLMRHFAPGEADLWAISNAEAGDAGSMRDIFSSMPHVRAQFLPLGRPADALAKVGKVGKVRAFAPTAVSLAKAARLIRREKIQVLHATDRPRDASFVALLGRLTGAKSVVHMHSSFGPHLTRPTLWGFEKASALFAVSEFTRRGLIGMGFAADKIHTVHNATDACFFDPERSRGAGKDFRGRLGIAADTPLAGVIARFNPWKGQRELIGALGQLRERFPKLHVLIIGSPVESERAVYETLAKSAGVSDRVHFPGFFADVRPALDALDLFVHPSFEEPFGLAITEAMAMQKPVVACRSGGVNEIITDKDNGLLVEPRSADAVADAMATLLSDPARSVRLGERARKTVIERFSPRKQCALVAQRYHELIQKDGP